MHPTADTAAVKFLQRPGAAGDAGRYVASRFHEDEYKEGRTVMPFLKRVRVPEKCPKCKGTYDKFGPKAHVCYPVRDREELPENRPELHHRDDLKVALSLRYDKKPEPPITARGTATVGTLLPEIEPVRKERPLKRRKAKPEPKDSNQPVIPETETRYESPKDIRDMDQTKDYAHAYREDGRLFGSHPSHDGFDDESNP